MVDVGGIGTTVGGIFAFVGGIDYLKVLIWGVGIIIVIVAIYQLWKMNNQQKKYNDQEIWR